MKTLKSEILASVQGCRFPHLLSEGSKPENVQNLVETMDNFIQVILGDSHEIPDFHETSSMVNSYPVILRTTMRLSWSFGDKSDDNLTSLELCERLGLVRMILTIPRNFGRFSCQF